MRDSRYIFAFGRDADRTTDSRRVKRSYAILGYAKLAFTPLALGFLLYFGWQSRETLYDIIEGARFSYLVLAVLAWVLLHFIAPILASLILKSCGSPVTYQFAFRTHAGRLPARYLPGGVWHTVGRMVDFHGAGIKPRHLTVLVFLETMLPAAVTFTYGGICVAYFRGLAGWGIIATLGAGCGIAGLGLLYLLLKWRFFRSAQPIPLSAYAKSVGIVTLFWSVAALSFLCYLSAFPLILSSKSFLEAGGIYIFSWAVGYVSVFAPQGIGVLEAVAGDMLSTSMSLAEIAAVIAGFRLIALLADAIVWVMSLLARVKA